MRDREYATWRSPPGVYRIALLGSSIDMGWGVATPDTYENLLEAWLNAEAVRRQILAGGSRSSTSRWPPTAPVQRYEAFHRKALAYRPRPRPDCSSTMLDPRLLEIHLGGLIKNRRRPQVRLLPPGRRRGRASTPTASGPGGWAELRPPGRLQGPVKDHYWIFADAVLGALAADCRSLRPPPRRPPDPPRQPRRRQRRPGPRRRPPASDRRPPRRPPDQPLRHLRRPSNPARDRDRPRRRPPQRPRPPPFVRGVEECPPGRPQPVPDPVRDGTSRAEMTRRPRTAPAHFGPPLCSSWLCG